MKFYKPKLLILLVLTMLLTFALGCVEKGIKPLSEMTSEEKITVMYKVYNSQYADYMRVMGYTKNEMGSWKQTFKPDLSVDQINILRKKKTALIHVYPIIKLYGTYIDSGRIPDSETEQKIFELLDSIVLLVPD